MTPKSSLHPGSVIDAHHHLWHYTAAEFDWIDDRMDALRRDFTTEDLCMATRTAGVNRTVAVQARQSLDETDMLLRAAMAAPEIAGVVGWLPLADPRALEAALSRYAGSTLLVGARHVVQAEPDGFLDGGLFNQGMDALREAGLTYDLLLRAGQLKEAARFVDRHPQVKFVVDHIAKPAIAARELEPWCTELRELSRRPNVFCKVSGMVTEDRWNEWSLASLRPYLDIVFEAFETGRIMVGSDWPVCLVATSYARWWDTIRTFLSEFSISERNAVLGDNAMHIYALGHLGKAEVSSFEGANNDESL